MPTRGRPKLSTEEVAKRTHYKSIGFVYDRPNKTWRKPKRMTKKYRAFLEDRPIPLKMIPEEPKTIVAYSGIDSGGDLEPKKFMSKMINGTKYYLQISLMSRGSGRASIQEMKEHAAHDALYAELSWLTRVGHKKDIVEKHSKVFSHTFVKADATSHSMIDHLSHLDNVFLSKLQYPNIKWELIPLPPDSPNVKDLIVKNSIDINCMINDILY